MQTGVADVVAVAKAAAQLRTSVCHAGVVIGTFHHIHTPYAVAGLQLLWVKARRRAEDAPCGFDENTRDKAVKPRNTQQDGKLFVARSRQTLHIAVNSIVCLLLGHDRLKCLVYRDTRQDLPFEVVLLLLACICIFSQQPIQPCIKSGVQLLGLRRKALCRLDYTMSEVGSVTDFVRQYTLASGGPYCDCGYKKKGFVKAGTEAGR